MKSGCKVREDLYFHVFPINNSTIMELDFLVRSTKGTNYFLKGFDSTVKALRLQENIVREKLNFMSDELGQGFKKYSSGGADALQRILKQYNSISFNHSFYQWHIACLSNKKLSEDFCFLRDAKHIEMMVAILTRTDSDHVIHLGIQRNITYALADNPYHHGISMLLHGCAASFVMENYPDKKFMVTNPLKTMKQIFKCKVPKESLYIVEDYFPVNIRKDLDSTAGGSIDRFSLEEMYTKNHVAVPLEALSKFKETAVENSANDSLAFVLKYGASMALLILVLCAFVRYLSDNEEVAEEKQLRFG